MPDRSLTPAAVMLEAARRFYPKLVFAIVATDSNTLDICSNAEDPGTVVDLLTTAADNIKETGVERKQSPNNLN